MRILQAVFINEELNDEDRHAIIESIYSHRMNPIDEEKYVNSVIQNKGMWAAEGWLRRN